MNTIPTSAAAMPPIMYPLNMTLTNVLRSRDGAYSVLSATAFGITPPSPSPARNRYRPTSHGVVARKTAPVKTVYSRTHTVIGIRRPTRSATVPKTMAPIIIPTSAALPISPAVAGMMPNSAIIRGTAAP